ncbi:MAG: SGNH/GDSL hydrolase family protein [Thermoanaerobaculia bacterium]
MRGAALGLAFWSVASSVATGGEAPAVVRIMALGDSITEGSTVESSYRFWLAQGLAASGVEFDFVGSLRGARSGPVPAGFDADHEGHWGWRADEVSRELSAWARAAPPDLALVHLGHNDLFQGESVETTIEDLRGIVGALREANERISVLLAAIVPSTYPSLSGVPALNHGIAELAAELDRPAARVLVVDLASPFDPVVHTLDGAHPNVEGARQMAAAWLAALREVLPAP